MHGRVKVKTTAQQQEEKRVEREAKLKSYRKAMAAILARRGEGRRDQQQLLMTAGVLQANADLSTLWNIRREVVEELTRVAREEEKEEVEKEEEEKQVEGEKKVEVEALLQREVELTQACLTSSPKSYSAWHHRAWALHRMDRQDWPRELALCDRFLSLDERNFHCWDYRKAVAARAGQSTEKELEFTRERIDTNFSNYSAWHYRSKLLPLLHPGLGAQPLAEAARLQELDLVQQAAFTDPSDSSAWLYHTWLAGDPALPTSLLWLAASQGRVTVAASSRVQARGVQAA